MTTLHIIVDAQNDFCHKDGSFFDERSQENKDSILRVIADVSKRFFTIASRDWHPANHCSFDGTCSNGSDKWPVHCVQGSWGSQIHELLSDDVVMVFNKGGNPELEEYSACESICDSLQMTLCEFISKVKPERIILSGFVLEFCVMRTLEGLLESFPEIDIELLEGGVFSLG